MIPQLLQIIIGLQQKSYMKLCILQIIFLKAGFYNIATIT